MGLFSACGEDVTQNYKVEFLEENTVMQEGDTIDIKPLLIASGGAIVQQVKFKSNNQNIAYVDPNTFTLFAVNEGIALIEANVGKSYAYFTVTVERHLEQFNSVTGFTYNSETSYLSWNATSISPTIFATSYNIQIFQNDVLQFESENVFTNNVNIKEKIPLASGIYSATVIAKREGYNNSEPAIFSFAVVPTPTNLNFSPSTSTLSWTEVGVEGVLYNIVFNKLTVPQTSSNYQTSDSNFIIPDDMSSVDDYSISVNAVLTIEDIVYTSATETVNLTRLVAPEISFSNDRISWDYSQASLISKYVLTITDSLGTRTIDKLTVSHDNFEEWEIGNNLITIKAIGAVTEDIISLDSADSNQITVVKLAPPTISFSPLTKSVSTTLSNTQILIRNTVTSVVVLPMGDSFLQPEDFYTFEQSAGIFEVFSRQMPTQEFEVASDFSNILNIKQLGNISGLLHNTSGGISSLNFIRSEGALGYTVTIDGENIASTQSGTTTITLTLGSTNSLFPIAKSGDEPYIISVSPFDDEFEYDEELELKEGYYLLSAEPANYNVVRLANITPLSDTTYITPLIDETITWDGITGAVNYSFEIYKDENPGPFRNGTTTYSTYSLDDFTFGDYEFFIKAIGNNQNYLDSMDFGSVSFRIFTQLDSPVLTFDNETEQLTVIPFGNSIQNADEYILLYDGDVLLDALGEPVVLLQNGGVCDVSHIVDVSGSFVFSAVAVSTDDNFDAGGNLIDSLPTEITIIRLANISSAPTHMVNGENVTWNWNEIENAVTYNFELTRDGEFYINGTTENLQYTFANLPFGDYIFSVKAMGDNNTILNAIDFSSSIVYRVFSTLASPTLTFNRENGNLTVSTIVNAEAYDIYCDYNDDGVLELSERLVRLTGTDRMHNVSDIVLNVGIYFFNAIALSLNDSADDGGVGNLFKSLPTEITVEKLISPTSILISENEEITMVIDPSLLTKLSAEQIYATVEGVQINFSTFEFSVTNEIVINFVALETISSPYYLDSATATFTINRLSTPNNLSFTDFILSWNENADAEYYEVIITKGLTYSQTLISSTNSLDLNDYPAVFAELDENFSFSVKSVIEDVTVNTENASFISSLFSNALEVTKLETPLITNVTPELTLNQTSVTVSWGAVQSATGFFVSVDGAPEEFIINTNALFSNTLAVRNYVLTLYAVNSNFIPSEITIFTLTRLPAVTEVTVFDSEIFSIYNLTNEVSSVIFNEGTGNEETVANINNSSSYSISFVTTTGESIATRLIGAGRLEGGDVYYLNSAVNSFNLDRITTMNAPLIDNDVISWVQTANANRYEIIIENSSEENISIVVNAFEAGTPVTSISIFHTSIANFISDAGIYEVRIRAIVVEELTLTNPYTGFLSSQFSTITNLIKLAQVLNVIAEAEDTVEQLEVTISWDLVSGAEKYNVYINNFETPFAITYTNSFSTEDLIFENAPNGIFNVRVMANAENYYNSDFSEEIIIQRLPSITNLAVNQLAVFSWAGTTASVDLGYYAYYHKSGYSPTTPVFTSNIYNDFTSEIFADITFSGIIDFYVLPFGDRDTQINGRYYFSGASSVIAKQKLDAPSIDIFGTYLTIDESIVNSNAQFSLTVKHTDGIDTVILDVTEVPVILNSNQVWEFPDIWTYQGVEVVGGTYIFEVFAFYNGTLNAINSATSAPTRTKLNALTFDGFLKANNDEQSISLQADIESNPINAIYTLSVAGTSYQNNELSPVAGKLIYPITEDLNFYIPTGIFTITIKVSMNGFLDSKITQISGKRLAPVNNIYALNGVLTWNSTDDVDCQGYLLRVLQTELNYIQIASPTTKNNLLTGISGDIVANLKCSGNLEAGIIKSENIILDSRYRMSYTSLPGGSYSYQDLNYTAHKLIAPTEISILNGEFKVFIDDDWTTNFIAKETLLNRNYNLDESRLDSGYFIGLSSAFYSGAQQLQNDVDYTFAIMATSSASSNLLNSDLSSSTLNIRLTPNPNDSSNDFTFDWNESSKNQFTVSWQAVADRTYSITMSCLHYEGGFAYIYNYNHLNFLDSYLEMNSDEYNDSLNDLYYQSGTYTFKVRIDGKSEPEVGGYYFISSAYSINYNFTKLSEVPVYVENGYLYWDNVSGANGYYIYYRQPQLIEIGEGEWGYEDEITYLTFISTPPTLLDSMQNASWSWELPDYFGELNENLYYFLGVRAVCTNDSLKIAPSGLGCFESYNIGFLAPVVKLSAPQNLIVQNGTLLWSDANWDYEFSSTTPYRFIPSNLPFNYNPWPDELDNNTIILRLQNEGGTGFNYYTVPAANFFRPNMVDASPEDWEVIRGYLGLSEDFEFGWPVMNWFTNELTNVPSGFYTISVKQNGDDYNWLNSRYNLGINVYIPSAPTSVSIDNYVLSWSESTYPIKAGYHYSTTDKFDYTVLAENIANGNRFQIATRDNDNRSVNLVDLVNADILPAGQYRLYVFVSGDSNMTIHGYPSTAVNITVLPTVNANMDGGVLGYSSSGLATGYNIIAVPQSPGIDTYEALHTGSSWDFLPLETRDGETNIIIYELSIQAIGNGTNVISGKVTDLGEISKLDSPSVDIVHGRFEWANVLNNSGYLVYVQTSTQLLVFDLPYGEVGLTSIYESITPGYNNYNFRTIGTTTSSFGGSPIYAISSYMDGINAVMLNSVASIGVHEGNLVWRNVTDLGGSNVTGYKISFFGTHIYNPFHYEEYSTFAWLGDTFVLYDFIGQWLSVENPSPPPEFIEMFQAYLAGDYDVSIQPYSNGEFEHTDGKIYKYLIGKTLEASHAEFTKLQQVSNVRIDNGVIRWNEVTQSTSYLLTFTRLPQVVTFTTLTNEFNPSQLTGDDIIKFESLGVNVDYEVKIKALGGEEHINSNETLGGNFKKLTEIDSVEYLSDPSPDGGFIIKWRFTGNVVGVTGYDYLFKYSYDGETYAEIAILGQYESSIPSYYYGQIESMFDTDPITPGIQSLISAGTLYFKICVIPITDSNNVLMSDYSVRYDVTPPVAIEDFSYFSSSRKIAWTHSGSGTFRIVDEIVSWNESTETFNVLSTRTYTSTVMEFMPELIGLHRIKVCAITPDGSIASEFKYFFNSVSENGLINHSSFVLTIEGVDHEFTLINFNLFESGEGTESNPYNIATSVQFANMIYRPTKPTYLIKDNDGDGIVEEIEKVFNFKQTANLTLVDVMISTFGGIYDGDNKTISWSFTNTTSIKATNIGLFVRLNANGIIKNLNIIANISHGNISSTDVNSLRFSSLVNENFGLISYCQIKNVSFSSATTAGIYYYYGGIACNNYGIIELCVNLATLDFNDTDITSSELTIGGIAYANNQITEGETTYTGTIRKSGNLANITGRAKTVNIGGVAAFNFGGTSSSENLIGKIVECYNKGNLRAKITLGTASNTYVGAITGRNEGIIRNCYNIASSLIVEYLNTATSARNAYIGGISGYIANQNGGKINNSFTTTLISESNSILGSPGGLTTRYLGLLVGLSGATSLSSGVYNYYISVIGVSPINNPPGNFNSIDISTVNLFNELNALYSNVWNSGGTYPVLIWESTYILYP